MGVTQDEKSQDLAVLAFLKGLGSADAGDELGGPGTPQLSDDVDAFLRAMGYNRIEREQLRRRRPRPPRPRSKNKEKDRAIAVERFRYYIEERLPGRPPEEIAELAQAWAGLTRYDLDLAQRWWRAGVDPGSPDQLVDALTEGLQVEHLGEVVGGKTIAEHLQAGNSPTWCSRALGWERPA
jgi:hypothetical protein